MKFGIKYLYCKYNNLKGFLTGRKGIRFTDICHYIKLENPLIADDESKKEFKYDKTGFNKIVLNDIDLTSHIVKFTDIQMTRRCHTLCLSNKRCCKKLFKKFKADLCIGIDVDMLVQMILNLIRKKGKKSGVEIVAKNVDYYGINYRGTHKSNQEIVFLKPEKDIIDNEFRIAIFYPNDARAEIHGISLFSKDTDEFIFINNTSKDGMKRIIKEAINNDGINVLHKI